MQMLLTEVGDESLLTEELTRMFINADAEIVAPGMVRTGVRFQPGAPPVLAFARQTLPNAEALCAASIREWSERLFEVTSRLPEGQPWRLHLAPHYGGDGAGENRMRFIRDAFRELLRKKRRHLLRTLEDSEAPFRETTSLVQLLLTAPDAAFLSVGIAPQPWQLRRCVWPFPKGEVPVASDKTAPSRAFAKLLEAELRLGQPIAANQTCVDLGACPGSWTYVAVNRGARVVSVDRSPLRADLMAHPLVSFQQGDAFQYVPKMPVDWLLCDVIAAPERSIGLVVDWARERRCRRFVVSIKFKGRADYAKLEQLKHALPPLCKEFFLTRLCANKNEACVMGTLLDVPSAPS